MIYALVSERTRQVMFKQLLVACAAVLLLGAMGLTAGGAPGSERMLARLPAPVKKTIRVQLGDGQLRGVEKNDENGDVTYDVEMVRQGRTRSFTVESDGDLLDSEVFLEELPAPIQQAIKAKVGNSTLGEINKTAGEETDYDVEMIGGGRTRKFTLDASGKLTNEEVFPGELPEGIQNAIRKEAGGGTLDEITRCFEPSGILYDVDVTENGKARTLTFDAKGALLSKEEDVALSEVPAAAQKEIQTLSGAGRLLTIARVTENATVSFDVDIRRNGRVKSYTLDSEGKLLASEGN